MLSKEVRVSTLARFVSTVVLIVQGDGYTTARPWSPCFLGPRTHLFKAYVPHTMTRHPCMYGTMSTTIV